MPATSFTPPVHGFRFPNRFEDIVVTDPSGKRNVVGLGRCGGMTYAALDFFNARIPVPPIQRVPYGLALGDYIWERQTHSAMDSLDKWLIMPANSQQQLNTWMIQDEMPKLMSRIDAGQPVPIGLIPREGMGIENGHQVVAHAYDRTGPDSWNVHVYDCNAPMIPCSLTVSRGGLVHEHAGGSLLDWRMLFVKEGYRPAPPRGYLLSKGTVHTLSTHEKEPGASTEETAFEPMRGGASRETATELELGSRAEDTLELSQAHYFKVHLNKGAHVNFKLYAQATIAQAGSSSGVLSLAVTDAEGGMLTHSSWDIWNSGEDFDVRESQVTTAEPKTVTFRVRFEKNLRQEGNLLHYKLLVL
jgi:hypothetical protein